MEPELVRDEEGVVIGVITRTPNDDYEALVQPRRGDAPGNRKETVREFDRLEDARRWIRANAGTEGIPVS